MSTFAGLPYAFGIGDIAAETEFDRLGRLSQQRSEFAAATGWKPSRVAALFDLGEVLEPDPLRCRRLVETYCRQAHHQQGEALRLLHEQAVPFADRVRYGDGRDLAVTLPTGIETRGVVPGLDGWPVRERIDRYAGLDEMLILWRHNRGPEYRNKIIGRVTGVDRSRPDPTVYLRISDGCGDIVAAARYSELSASVAFTADDVSRDSSKRGGATEHVKIATVGELSLCWRSEATYPVQIEHATPTAEMQAQHRAAMTPVAPLHLRQTAQRTMTVHAGVMTPGQPVRWAGGPPVQGNGAA